MDSFAPIRAGAKGKMTPPPSGYESGRRTKEPRGFDFGSIALSYDAWYDTDEGRLYDRLEKRAVERLLHSPAGAWIVGKAIR